MEYFSTTCSYQVYFLLGLAVYYKRKNNPKIIGWPHTLVTMRISGGNICTLVWLASSFLKSFDPYFF